MKKSIALIFTLVTFIALFSGCGKNETNENGNTDGQNEKSLGTPIAVYIKNNQLYISETKNPSPIQISATLWSRKYDQNVFSSRNDINHAIFLTDDNAKLFFPENYNDGTFDLYYYDIKKNESFKIDSDVYQFEYEPNGNNVYYYKAASYSLISPNTASKVILYRYDFDKSMSIGPVDGCLTFENDPNVLVYKTDYNGVTEKVIGSLTLVDKDANSTVIDASFSYLDHFSKETKTIYYRNSNNDFYKYELGKESVKIADNLGGVENSRNCTLRTINDDGEFYFQISKPKDNFENTNEWITYLYYFDGKESKLLYTHDFRSDKGDDFIIRDIVPERSALVFGWGDQYRENESFFSIKGQVVPLPKDGDFLINNDASKIFIQQLIDKENHKYQYLQCSIENGKLTEPIAIDDPSPERIFYHKDAFRNDVFYKADGLYVK